MREHEVDYVGKEDDERIIKAIEEMEELYEPFNISDFDFMFTQEEE